MVEAVIPHWLMFPHPFNWMFIEFLSTFKCCEWAYGYILTLLPVEFWRIGVRQSPNNIGVSCSWGCKSQLTASQKIFWMYMKRLSTFRCCVAWVGASLCCYTCVKAKFWKIGVPLSPNDIGVSCSWGSKPLLVKLGHWDLLLSCTVSLGTKLSALSVGTKTDRWGYKNMVLTVKLKRVINLLWIWP
jgi:hypothetical protein